MPSQSSARVVGTTIGINVLWIPLAFLTDGLSALVLPSRLADLPGAATLAGLISFAGLGAAMVAQPLAGALSDRFRDRIDRRAFMVAAAVPILTGLWAIAGASGAVAVAISFVVVQVAGAALQAPLQALIPEHVAQPARGQASGLKVAFDIGGAFVAFLALGAVLEAAGVGTAAALIAAVLAAALAAMLALAPRGQPGASAPAQPRRAADHAGLPSAFVPLVASRFLFLLGTYVVGRFLFFLVAERLEVAPGAAAGQAGAFLAMFTLTAAVSALPFGALADRAGRSMVMGLGVVLSASGILLLVPAAGSGGILLGGAVMSLGTGAFATANWAAIVDVVPAARSGGLMGLANLGTAGAAAVAGLAGAVIDNVGFAPALVLAAGAAVAAGLPLIRRPRTPQLELSA